MNVQTFSAGFDVGGHYNELDSGRQVATAIGSDHHELVVESFSVPALQWHRRRFVKLTGTGETIMAPRSGSS
jgi:asparagine synthetase B (glutamine-hydrolysing)